MCSVLAAVRGHLRIAGGCNCALKVTKIKRLLDQRRSLSVGYLDAEDDWRQESHPLPVLQGRRENPTFPPKKRFRADDEPLRQASLSLR
jgi:hypothetical protein